MPQIANITVKAANGTTDVVYTAMTPSSGDTTPAFWRAEGSGASASLRATFQLSSKWNGPKTARRVTGAFQYPQTATVDGVERSLTAFLSSFRSSSRRLSLIPSSLRRSRKRPILLSRR